MELLCSESHWECLHKIFYLGIRGTFRYVKSFFKKKHHENTGMGIIRKKEVIKGKSQSGKEPKAHTQG